MAKYLRVFPGPAWSPELCLVNLLPASASKEGEWDIEATQRSKKEPSEKHVPCRSPTSGLGNTADGFVKPCLHKFECVQFWFHYPVLHCAVPQISTAIFMSSSMPSIATCHHPFSFFCSPSCPNPSDSKSKTQHTVLLYSPRPQSDAGQAREDWRVW